MSNQPKDERYGVEAMPREGVRMCIAWPEGVKTRNARREAMDLDAVSGEPAAARSGGGFLLGVYCGDREEIKMGFQGKPKPYSTHI